MSSFSGRVKAGIIGFVVVVIIIIVVVILLRKKGGEDPVAADNRLPVPLVSETTTSWVRGPAPGGVEDESSVYDDTQDTVLGGALKKTVNESDVVTDYRIHQWDAFTEEISGISLTKRIGKCRLSDASSGDASVCVPHQEDQTSCLTDGQCRWIAAIADGAWNYTYLFRFTGDSSAPFPFTDKYRCPDDTEGKKWGLKLYTNSHGEHLWRCVAGNSQLGTESNDLVAYTDKTHRIVYTAPS